jgi:riboflavin synthase
MFTGIITAQGEVTAIDSLGEGQDMRLTVAVPEGWLEGAVLGASIACSGCCLTAVELEPAAFTVEASAETLAKTTLGGWQVGRRINLERPLKMGDELGGHVVSGHVDGLGEVLASTPEYGSTRWRFRVPPAIAPFIAPKGSVAIDGVSLTVNEVEGHEFGVNIIAHTSEVTGFAQLRPGHAVNIEIDMLARYVARLREFNA